MARDARQTTPDQRDSVVKRFACDTPRFTYDARHLPIGEVQPGELFQVETIDCFSGLFQQPEGFTDENIAFTEENLDGVTGPLCVAGATPGDVLAVTIHEIRITTPGSVVLSHCRAPWPRDWWAESFSCRSYRIEDGHLVLSSGMRIPVRPMIGCIATAPAREVFLSTRGGDFGGNMDCAAIAMGATVLLPVGVTGGLLYFGDCKARMGDGEVVQPPEVGTVITASATVRPRPTTMCWPRVETPDLFVTVVSAQTIDAASQLAFKELLDWLETDCAMDRVEAAQLMAVTADLGICQIPNALPTARCTVARRWFEQ